MTNKRIKVYSSVQCSILPKDVLGCFAYNWPCCSHLQVQICCNKAVTLAHRLLLARDRIYFSMYFVKMMSNQKMLEIKLGRYVIYFILCFSLYDLFSY
jgi:hypothetical protein